MAEFADGGGSADISEQLKAIRALNRSQGDTLLHFFTAPLPDGNGAQGSSTASNGSGSDPLSSFILQAIVSRRMYSPEHSSNDTRLSGGATASASGGMQAFAEADNETDEYANLASALTLAVICARFPHSG